MSTHNSREDKEWVWIKEDRWHQTWLHKEHGERQINTELLNFILHQELQKVREEEVSNIIADYMEALGTVQLPQEVWLWIAEINGKYLNKTLKENI